MYNSEKIIRKSKQVAKECSFGGCNYDHVLIGSLCCQVRELCGRLNDVDRIKADQISSEEYLKEAKKACDAVTASMYKQAEVERQRVGEDFAICNWDESLEDWHKRNKKTV